MPKASRRREKYFRKSATRAVERGAAHVPGARVVENPVALARAVADLAGIPPQRGKRES